MEEGRKRVLGIIAGILVARHLKTTEDLHDSRCVHARSRWLARRCNGPSEL
jgi:hypothetical protein